MRSTPSLAAVAALLAPALGLGCGDDVPAVSRGAGGAGGAPLCEAAGAAGSATSDGSNGPAGAGAAPTCVSNPTDYAYPFWDPCQPIEARLANLLATLTIDEKLTLLNGGHPAVPRLGVPGASLGTEALHGLGVAANPNAPTGSFNPMSTQFPQVFGLGESWDPEVARTVGATTGTEARAYSARGVSDTGRGLGVVMRGPNVDLVHDPRWGRTEESYGEDPYLIGEMAKGYLAGLHGDDPTYLLAAGTLKHFAANSNETTRLTSSSNLDARNMREYYTATFRTAVREGHADGIMTAYNQINDVPAGVSPILKSIVRGEWGFDGFFSTDGQAATHWVQDQHYFDTVDEALAAAIAQGSSGVLLQSMALQTVTEGFSMGLMTEADIDGAIGPALRVRFRTGDFDPPAAVPYRQVQATDTPWATPEAAARALDVTRRTITLLKNANGTLPLDRTAIHSLAVIGPRADQVVRDWYGGTPAYPYVTGVQGIVNKVGADLNVVYVLNDNGGAATSAAAVSDAAVVFVGNHPTCGEPYPPWGTCPSPYEGREQVDRVYIELEPSQLALVQSIAAVNPRTIVVLVSSFPQAIPWIDDNVPAILHVANSGQELGNAVADVLFGDYNPGGHTTTTWYRSTADLANDVADYDIKKGMTYWYFSGTPLYPFGHGLSYSTFEYSHLSLSAASLPASTCGTVDVGVDVTNTSAIAGDEVVQLYLSYPDSGLQRPLKQLRGFRRVTIAPGDTAHVSMQLRSIDLAYWDDAAGRFAVENGKTVDVNIGASSRDIRLRGTLVVTP